MESNDIDLVIFTCENREHLLTKSLDSFRSKCSHQFSRIILAIDGQVSDHLKTFVSPDVIVQSNSRKGYVNSILNALPLVCAPSFFWLEDDWEFESEVNLAEMNIFLRNHDHFAQVILPRSDLNLNYPTTFDQNFAAYSDGFSANPCLCNTSLMKQIFEELRISPKTQETKIVGFENFVSNYITQKSLVSIVFQPNRKNTKHIGDLESTAREFHMINSIDQKLTNIGKEYISGFGYNKTITIRSKILMIPKLWVATFTLSYYIFFKRQAYDFALRIYLSFLKGYQN